MGPGGRYLCFLSFHRTQHWSSEQRYSIVENNFKRDFLGKRLFLATSDFVLSFSNGVASPENIGTWNPLSPNTTLSTVLLTHQLLQITCDSQHCPIWNASGCFSFVKCHLLTHTTGLNTILLINYWVQSSKQLQSIFASLINVRLEDQQQAAANLRVKEALGWDSPDLDGFGKEIWLVVTDWSWKKKEI